MNTMMTIVICHTATITSRNLYLCAETKTNPHSRFVIFSLICYTNVMVMQPLNHSSPKHSNKQPKRYHPRPQIVNSPLSQPSVILSTSHPHLVLSNHHYHLKVNFFGQPSIWFSTSNPSKHFLRFVFPSWQLCLVFLQSAGLRLTLFGPLTCSTYEFLSVADFEIIEPCKPLNKEETQKGY